MAEVALSKNEPAIWFPAVRAGTGADVFTKLLVAGLRARGIRAEITWLPHRAEYAPWTVPVPKPPAWANVVHINSWLHRRFHPKNLPIITTVHHCVQDPGLRRYKSLLQRLYHSTWITPMERHSIHTAAKVVADSAYTSAQLSKFFALDSAYVIYPSIDTSEFTPPLARAIHKPFRLLYVGTWSSRKGSDLISPIMQSLGSAFELQYTGQPHEVYLKKLPSNCKRIVPARTKKELVAIYQQADALLFPSRLEGFGLVAVEAQACGLPVIATKGSSLLEVVEDKNTGILCEMNNVRHFADAARALATDHELWKSMSHSAREHAVSSFAASTFIDDHIKIYCATLGNA